MLLPLLLSLFGSAAEVEPVEEYDAMRGRISMGPRLTGVVSMGERMQGKVSAGVRLTGKITILPG